MQQDNSTQEFVHTPKVSVLIALYRAGQFLEAKLESLRRQTIIDQCQCVFLICQNLDGELALCEKFAEEWPMTLIKVYDEHCKLYDSWNDGILASTGKYLTNSNADDMLHPEIFERLSTTLDGDQTHDVAMGNSVVTAHVGQQWPWTDYHGLIETIYPLGTAGPCPMWRRELHDKFGLFPSYRVVGDALMWQQWHAGGVKFLHVQELLSAYYQAGGHNLETRVDPATGMRMRDLDVADMQKTPLTSLRPPKRV